MKPLRVEGSFKMEHPGSLNFLEFYRMLRHGKEEVYAMEALKHLFPR